MKTKWMIFSLATILALILTACGGGGGAAANQVNLTITATESGYDAPSYTVPAGAKVAFTLKNNGSLEHNFVIMKLNKHVESPFDDGDKDNVFWSLNGIPGQQSKSDTFTAPTEPGDYDIICSVPGHIEMGMVAKLVVK